MALHTGKPLHQYIIDYRLTRAAGMMRTSGKTITEIAASVGYRDVSYFSRAFKSRFGKSPIRYQSQFLGFK
jgi:AraC-like DNA-binding protein